MKWPRIYADMGLTSPLPPQHRLLASAGSNSYNSLNGDARSPALFDIVNRKFPSPAKALRIAPGYPAGVCMRFKSALPLAASPDLWP